MKSLSQRLQVLLLSALTVAALFAGVSAYLKSEDELSEFFDYQLRQMAHSLRGQSSFEHYPKELSTFERDDGLSVQVWQAGGRLIYASAPDRQLPRAPKSGMQTVSFQNGDWRVYLLSHNDRTIQVSQALKARRAESLEFAQGVLIPLFFIFSALALTVWFIVRATLKPLTAVANGVARLSPGSLEPLPEKNLPVEILPLVQKLNCLFDQLTHAFEVQQRFVADAAHELRTPLTVVKLQVRILERSSSNEERADALSRLRAGVDRAARLAGQLLALARVEPEAPQAPPVDVSINRLINEIMTEVARIASEKRISLSLNEAETVTVSGDPDALRAMISNLLDNALRYTPSGGAVTLELHQSNKNAVIAVSDNGPGIPVKERERIFDRFYRGQRLDSTGSGLGLAIVKSAVTRHGGTVSLADAAEGKGLRVTIMLPLKQQN